MTPTALDPIGEAADFLTPEAVSVFLSAHGWELENRRPGIREIWRLEDSPEFGSARVMLPLATEYVDFRARFKDVLDSLCHVYEIDARELRERVSATNYDLFFVRINQPMTDGSIPFRQAGKTVDSLYRMMKAAATTAADPHHSHKGRRPGAVADFLDDCIKLGQTRRGSYVFTVSVLLDDTRPANGKNGDTARTTFPRQVMTTLARGLESTRRLALRWDERILETPWEFGLSSALVESIEEMTRPDRLHSLDLRFEWAALFPPKNIRTSTIVFDRDTIAELPRLRERLVRREEPARRVTLVGIVKSLAREETPPGEDDVADVTLLTEVGGKPRSVHVELEGDDHDWAIMAYQRKLPLVVTGDLSFERRTWRLSGEIEMDTGFLRHFSEAHPPMTSEEENP
ncbi:hypothetical protein [Nocardiopsis lucentensis]|uniref:hypothetical protein n=1 Tax=Nocardiopsis lucentensis TaxID=53441 RepID=UPI000346C0C2|nr:hypothetical protein [Nocardiopsis lucentensis]